MGPYQIVGLVGVGGMGEVYRARDTRLDRTVAVKILSPEIDTPGARERFDREARAISSLTGPHICSLFDVGNQEGRAAEPLTEREAAVLRLLGGTLSLREIGNELYVSANTVKTHTQAIYRKLGVSTRHEAVAQGKRLGL